MANRETFVWTLRRGSDSRLATGRSQLQSRRSKLNIEINKEMRLRCGAENLYKVATNKEIRDAVALELSFFNSNLRLLREQLSELNSSVDVYQKEEIGNHNAIELPLIPLGLKETKEIDFLEIFKDFILEHYSEDGANYKDAIADFMDIRQAMRTPARNSSGVTLLLKYLDLLSFVEKRFFSLDRNLGIYFEWYDSLSGVPSCQRTMAFEKASVLFNLGAIYTQLALRCDRQSIKGLDDTVDNFLKAAGIFQYIQENFTNAPPQSDLSYEILDMLVQLMVIQARECLFRKQLEQDVTGNHVDDDELNKGREAAYISEAYNQLISYIYGEKLCYIPFSWISLAYVKQQHYLALSHFHFANKLLGGSEADNNVEGDVDSNSDLSFSSHGGLYNISETEEEKLLRIQQNRRYLAKAHFHESIMLHEESLRLVRISRELQGKEILRAYLRSSHECVVQAYSVIDDENDFQDDSLLDPPQVYPATRYHLSFTFPALNPSEHTDLFRLLGPLKVFNASNRWSVARHVTLSRNLNQGYGFSIQNQCPVIVAKVDKLGLAHVAGVCVGDYMMAIDSFDVKWATHEEVVERIKAAGTNLKISIATPL